MQYRLNIIFNNVFIKVKVDRDSWYFLENLILFDLLVYKNFEVKFYNLLHFVSILVNDYIAWSMGERKI